MSLLSKGEILKNLGRGIIIHPFNNYQLKSCSYDVRIGEYFYRRKEDHSDCFFNPYDESAVARHFQGPFEGKPAKDFSGFGENRCWNGIDPDDQIIMIQPGELILAHTDEFIGGTRDFSTGKCFTAEMKARSSIGRIGFEVCRCAGWGDVGYINRWTMEIKNDDPSPAILVVGTRVAQMKFYEVGFVAREDLYGYDPERDHYQRFCDKTGDCSNYVETVLEENIKNWVPQMLIPKLTKE